MVNLLGSFDITGAEYSHYGDQCTFDYILKKHQLTDRALLEQAEIVRGADTDKLGLTPQSAGLWAISAGLSYNFRDDQQQLQFGMTMYDALYSWARYVRDERHNWPGAV